MVQKKIIEKIKTQMLHSATYFFLFENRTFYEVTLKNIVEPGSPQITIWNILITCGIPKSPKTHT
jgi:hypothetical protein